MNLKFRPTMNQDNFKVTWDTYPDHVKNMLHEMMTSDYLTDVTLVCDDDIQIKAHKIVLSACSNVFKKIINSLPLNDRNAVIYLRGIQHKEMESILEFMYLGETTYHKDKMDEFLNVSKSLDIKELCEDMELLEPKEAGWVEMNEFLKESINSETKKAGRNTSFESNELKSEFIDVDNSEESNDEALDSEGNAHIPKDTEMKFVCDKCDKQFSQKRLLSIHVKSVHKGIKFQCNECDKSFSQQANLYTHTNSAHKGLYFGCGKCEYKTSTNGNLKKHILSLKHY